MNLSYALSRAIFLVVLRSYFWGRFQNMDRIPPTGPVILASNHASFMDPLLLGTAIPRQISFLARADLYPNPIVGPILRSWGVVPVDRDGGGAAGLKVILDRLLAGGGILLFPEGTRTPDGTLQPARSGIGLTVIKSTCPVLPVRIFGTYECFGKHAKIPRPGAVAVKVGEPLDLEGVRREAKTCSRPRLKEIYQQVADGLMAAIGRIQPGRDVRVFPE